MAFKKFCNGCGTWHRSSEPHGDEFLSGIKWHRKRAQHHERQAAEAQHNGSSAMHIEQSEFAAMHRRFASQLEFGAETEKELQDLRVAVIEYLSCDGNGGHYDAKKMIDAKQKIIDLLAPDSAWIKTHAWFLTKGA